MTPRDERLSAAGGLLAALVVGLGMLLTSAQVSPDPALAALWWVAYGVYVVVFALDSGLLPSSLRLRLPDPVTVGVLAVTQTVVWFIAPNEGLTAILFVVTAATAAFMLSRRGVAAVIAGNTLVIAVGAAMAIPTAVAVVFTTMTYLSFQLFAVMVILGARREAEARSALAVAHADLRAATALLATSSRNSERLRIARDLHDVIGHQMTALALELEVASHRATGDALEHVTRARGIAKDLLGDVRTTVGALRDVPASLEPTLRALVEHVPGLEVDLLVDERRPLDEARTIAVVRCVQEVLTNTVRHAGASHLRLAVTSDEDGVVVDARDDGRGATVVRLGNGLTGMTERVEELGGELRVESSPGRGFGVVVRVPAA
ncbi:sensor histidine kinase [Antribacter gilvus]|uniref:sensor histidine kinase n=1 Tax=Antribacter gilvus TaxID=2304675 RepID=UPI000F781C23|nr:sensor histidine kinase [Antribacter gilvus]